MNATTLLSQMSRSAAGGGESFLIILTISALVVGIGMTIFFFSRYQKCPSDRILVVYGKTGGGVSFKFYMVERLLFGMLYKPLSTWI